MDYMLSADMSLMGSNLDILSIKTIFKSSVCKGEEVIE